MNRIIINILLLLVSACGPRYDPRPKNPSWGSLSVKMNGKEWKQTYPKGYWVIQGLLGTEGSGVDCKGDINYINAELYTWEGYLRQNLFFAKVPLVQGKYKVVPQRHDPCGENPIYGVLYALVDDGDVLGAKYSILSSEDNFMQILSYDDESKEIKATFQLTLVRVNLGGAGTVPDTLRFTEGKFHTKILDVRR